MKLDLTYGFCFFLTDDIVIPNGQDSISAGGEETLNGTKEEASSEVEKNAEENAKDESGEEVVMIQDAGFNIKIAVPGVDPFDLPVSVDLYVLSSI